MTIDNSNKYIGVVRFRQQRSIPRTCSVGQLLLLRNLERENCSALFDDGGEYDDFSEGWNTNDKSDPFARMDSVWKYRRASDTGTLFHIGRFATYPGGGYIATLGRNMKNSLINTRYLFRNKWLDGQTRCNFIEFLLYSPNSNLFNAVTIKFEISPTGYILPEFNVDTAHLLFVAEGVNILEFIIIASFFLVVIALTVRAIYKIKRYGKQIRKDTWTLVDITIVVFSIASIILYWHRHRMVKEFLMKIENAKNNEFVNYFHLFFAETSLTILAAILVFVATLRLWKLLRFLKIIKVVEKTILLSLRPLIGLFLLQLIWLFYFVIVGRMFFGDQVNEFKDVDDTIMTILLMSLNFYFLDMKHLKSNNHYLFDFAFYLGNLLLLNIYVTLITISYGDAEIYYSNEKSYTVINYLKETCNFHYQLIKVKWWYRRSRYRLRGGSSETRNNDQVSSENSPVSAKQDAHRYADCISISSIKMQRMVYITLCTLRNIRYKYEDHHQQHLDKNDIQLIKETIVTLFRQESDDSVELFFKGENKNSKVILVDDVVFVKMARFVKALLTGYEQKMMIVETHPFIVKHAMKLDDLQSKVKLLLTIIEKIAFGDEL